MTSSRGETDRSAEKKLVWNILHGARRIHPVTPLMVRRAIFLGRQDERRGQLHAAGLLVSRCAQGTTGGDVESYDELLNAQHRLKVAGDDNPLVRREMTRTIDRNRRRAEAYQTVLRGVAGWQIDFGTALLHPLEMDLPEDDPNRSEEPPLKLDHAALWGIIERTSPLGHPAIVQTEILRRAGQDEYTRDVFQLAGHLLRFIIDPQPLGSTAPTS